MLKIGTTEVLRNIDRKTFAASYYDKAVLIPKELYNREEDWSRDDLIRLMHEFGHMYNKHRASPLDSIGVIQGRELEARSYVYDCIKPEYYQDVNKIAWTCLKTYL